MKKLSYACKEGKFKKVKKYLKKGKDPNESDTQNCTPLHLACKSKEGFKEIAELLIKHGANVNYLDEDNVTPFNGAVRLNRANIVKTFFELGTNLDLNIRNDYGNTAFEDTFGSRKRFGNVGKLMIYQDHIKN